MLFQLFHVADGVNPHRAVWPTDYIFAGSFDWGCQSKLDFAQERSLYEFFKLNCGNTLNQEKFRLHWLKPQRNRFERPTTDVQRLISNYPGHHDIVLSADGRIFRKKKMFWFRLSH